MASDMSRTRVIGFRVTQDENILLRKAADLWDVPLSDFVRRAALAHATAVVRQCAPQDDSS